MAVIKLLSGTTADYKAVENVLVLDDREIAVEIATGADGKQYYNIRQGDGKSTFFKLPIIVNNQRFEEIVTAVSKYRDEIMGFQQNITTATANATEAAEQASSAAQLAQSEATKIESLTQGLNAMTDTGTGKTYILGIENGIVYLEESSS